MYVSCAGISAPQGKFPNESVMIVKLYAPQLIHSHQPEEWRLRNAAGLLASLTGMSDMHRLQI